MNLRQWWDEFMGRDVSEDLEQEARRNADEIDTEFKLALEELRERREKFDTRPPPHSNPPGMIELGELEREIEKGDRLMREALDELE